MTNKTLRIWLFATFLVTILSCHKEPLPETNPFVGTWNIINVDSVFAISTHEGYSILKTLNYKGILVFNNDSTGYLRGSVTGITEQEELFIWSYDSSYPDFKHIKFGFLNGSTSTPAIEEFIRSSDNQIKASEGINLEFIAEELFILSLRYRECVQSANS